MSHAPKSRPAKRSPNRKAASEALFNPAVFLETTARVASLPRIRRKKSSLPRATMQMRFSISGRARSKSPSYPKRARKPSSRSWGQTNLLAKDA